MLKYAKAWILVATWVQAALHKGQERAGPPPWQADTGDAQKTFLSKAGNPQNATENPTWRPPDTAN